MLGKVRHEPGTISAILTVSILCLDLQGLHSTRHNSLASLEVLRTLVASNNGRKLVTTPKPCGFNLVG